MRHNLDSEVKQDCCNSAALGNILMWLMRTAIRNQKTAPCRSVGDIVIYLLWKWSIYLLSNCNLNTPTMKNLQSYGVLNGHTLCIAECAGLCVLSSDDNINHIWLGRWNIHVHPSPISWTTKNSALLFLPAHTDIYSTCILHHFMLFSSFSVFF